MKKLLGTVFAVFALFGTGGARETVHPETGIDDALALNPAPYELEATVLSSGDNATILEVTVTPIDFSRLPSNDRVAVGLIAIAPTGDVEASILNAEGVRLSDLSGPSALLPSSAPSHAVILGRPGIWRDLRVADLSIIPCWNTDQGPVLATRLEVRIENAGGVGVNEKTRATAGVSPLWDRLYRRHVLNYDMLNLPQLERGTGKRFIVVSRAAFDTQTAQFVEWKTGQGYGVDLITLEDLGYTNPTSSAAMNATKNYIAEAYSHWAEIPEFVLLVGDMDNGNLLRSIWTQTFYNVFYYQGYRPHDQWYGFLEGDDVFADIMVGRLPETSLSAMNYLFAKTIAYEKTPYIEGGNAWQRHGIMTLDAGISETINVKHLVSDLLSGWGMNIDEFFSSPWNVIPAMNEGFTFYNYRGDYCGSTGWGSTFYDTHVPYVQNINKPGVFTILSCSSGCFDYSYRSTAELLLRHDYTTPSTLKGAVAFIGSQAYTAYQYNNPLDEGFYRSWTGGEATLLGEAFLGGKAWAWEHMYPGFDPERRECMMREYTILGDPSLQVWTNVPQTMNIAAVPNAVPMNQTTNVQVTATDASRAPVADALICLWRDPDVFVYGYTNALGHVTLPVTPTSMGSISLTATASNMVPVFESLDVVPTSGPYVVYAGNTLQGDGTAEIGEIESLDVELQNIGSETAYSVTCALSTSEPAVTVTGAVRLYGDIAVGNTALPASPFVFEVGALPDLFVVPFDLEITSGDSIWYGAFDITVHAPDLAVSGVDVLDPSGNGNGQPDPGETVELRVLVQNDGSGVAQDARITLSDTDPYVTISGPATQSLGSIAPEAQVTSPGISVTFDGACPPAYAAMIPVHFEANDAVYAADTTLILTVGQNQLLFVDADNEETETRITSVLEGLRLGYTRWNAWGATAVVPVDTLARYKTVLWAAGDQNTSSVIDENRANLSSYLTSGGTLLLSAENYLTAYGGDSFTSNYLHIASYDINIGGSTVYGENGDPIGDGVTVTLDYPTELSDTPDGITPDVDAAIVLRMQGGNDPVALRYPGDGLDSYRVIFFGVALEAFPTSGMDPNNLQSVLDRSLTWLWGEDLSAPTAPGDPDYGSDGTLSWSPSSDNIGVDHYCVYRSTDAYFAVGGMTPITTTAGTSVLLPEGIGNPDVNYVFRITAKDAANNESPASSPVGEYDFLLEE